MTIRHFFLPIVLLCITTTAVASEDWSGFYIGPHGGYAWSNTSWLFPYNEYYNLSGDESFRIKPKGELLGGHLALNHQVGSAVLGVEASLNGGELKQHLTGPVTPDYPDDFFETTIDNIQTMTVKFGYARNAWQLYTRGGFAIADIALEAISGNPGAGVIANSNTRQSGWTAGAGLEYMILPALVFGIQYDYLNFGSQQYSALTTGMSPHQPFNIDLQQININMVTARISVKIDDLLRH